MHSLHCTAFVTQEKIKTLQAELQAVTKSKTMLEKELQEVITLTSTELEEYQEKVLELEDEVSKYKALFYSLLRRIPFARF